MNSIFTRLQLALAKEGTKKIVGNIIWLLLDKVVRLGLGVVVIVLLARYLGPEQFGLYNYTTALVALFTAFSGLGLNAIMTRDLVTRSDKGVILGTAFGLRVFSSAIAYLALIICVFLLRGDDALAKILTLIIGLSLFFNSSEVIKFWFESQITSKFTVVVENSVFLVLAAVQLGLIYFEAPLIAFGYVVAAQAVFVFVGLFVIYFYTEQASIRWHFKLSEAKYLLSQSWPLIISGTAWVIYTKIDQIMIGQMLDDAQVGFYSAASRLSEIAVFLPAIVTFSVVPAILKLKQTNRELYTRRFQELYYVLTTGMVGAAIIVTLLSNWIIHLLYGAQYAASAAVLAIHFWIVIFITLATISGRYLVNDNLQKFTMKRHLLGVVLNVPFNYVAIPLYGINGAAVASLLALAVANYLYDLFDKQTRDVFIHKTKALCFFWIYELAKKRS